MSGQALIVTIIVAPLVWAWAMYYLITKWWPAAPTGPKPKPGDPRVPTSVDYQI
jgi:hypothetical protein